MDVVIRKMEDQDVEGVVSLELGEKRNRYGAYVFVRQSAELYPGTFLVADNNETIIGYTIGAQVQGDAATAWVLRLGVARQYRNRGIGTALLSQVIQLLARLGVRQIFLSVSPENKPALLIYSKLGFNLTQHRNGYFGKGEDRDLLMLLVPSQP